MKEQAWGEAPIKQEDNIDWAKLDTWARETLVCLKCGRKVSKGERAKMYLRPNMETREAEVRIVHYTCLGYEDDGVTPWQKKLIMPITKGVGK